MPGTTEVLIAGAGPVGLTAACELARRGVRVRLVDREAGPRLSSRGKGVQPRTLEVLDGLGVAGRVVSCGRFRMPLRFYDGSGGHREHDLSEGAEPGPDNPYGRSLLVPQWRVEEALRARLAEFGGAVEYGVEVRSVADRTEHVEVEFADGSRSAPAYVLGCDGGGSVVRRSAGLAFRGETDETYRMLLGDVLLDGLDRDHWHIWDGGVALCPLPSTDAFQLQAPLGPVDAEPTPERFQRIVDDAVGPGRVRLREVLWGSLWRLNERLAERFRRGRVLLAGDAAHVHSPGGGQGMNTGIQDAVNLGWKLAAVLAGADPALLDTYEQERRPIAAGVLGLSRRALQEGLVSRRVTVEEKHQLGHTYRGGPLAAEVDGPGPRPGDRAPDGPCRYPDGRPVRLFDLQRGGGWTLYGFGVRPEDVPGVRAVGIDVDVLDAEGHARAAYSAEDGELVLVRPDGHVGARGRTRADITGYLEGIGLGGSVLCGQVGERGNSRDRAG